MLKGTSGNCIIPLVGAIGLGCAILIILPIIAISMLGYNFGGGDSGGGASASWVASEGLSDKVPPNFASLFTEASKASSVPAPMIAAIYLTEHGGSGNFGADLKSIDDGYDASKCTENGSGAAGPMQFIPSSWPASKLISYGIANPDRCKYRDSIIGAGFLLAGKATYKQVSSVCSKNAEGNWNMTDTCVSAWGQAYCGLGSGRTVISGCSNKNCGYPKHPYCEVIVKMYKITAPA